MVHGFSDFGSWTTDSIAFRSMVRQNQWWADTAEEGRERGKGWKRERENIYE